MVSRRKNMRLRGYDYTQNGAYFITICMKNRKNLLGDIQNSQIITSSIGDLIRSAWQELPTRYPGISIDAFVIMPNHIHGIIIVGATFMAPSEGSMNRAPTFRWYCPHLQGCFLPVSKERIPWIFLAAELLWACHTWQWFIEPDSWLYPHQSHEMGTWQGKPPGPGAGWVWSLAR